MNMKNKNCPPALKWIPSFFEIKIREYNPDSFIYTVFISSLFCVIFDTVQQNSIISSSVTFSSIGCEKSTKPNKHVISRSLINILLDCLSYNIVIKAFLYLELFYTCSNFFSISLAFLLLVSFKIYASLDISIFLNSKYIINIVYF